MSIAYDYWKFKQAQEALMLNDLSSALGYFRASTPTAKVNFNMGVISLWMDHIPAAINYFKLSIKTDPLLAIASFYLGILEIEETGNNCAASIGWFEACLRGFRSCKFIDYMAVGMPFVLEREDVLFNLTSLQRTPSQDGSGIEGLKHDGIETLKGLSIPNIRTIFSDASTSTKIKIRRPPLKDRQMIFNLLPKIDPIDVSLKGPEFISLVEGEIDHTTGFHDAHTRSVTLEI